MDATKQKLKSEITSYLKDSEATPKKELKCR
jgi:hypothetical protein